MSDDIKRDDEELSPDDEIDIVPSEYKGMPSDLVRELWHEAQYTDANKTKTERDRRMKALDAIHKEEASRETKKAQSITGAYQTLPDNKKTEFKKSQKESTEFVMRMITGAEEAEGRFQPEEKYILSKLKTAFEDARAGKQNTEKLQEIFDIKDEISRAVWDNMINRMALDMIQATIAVDKEAARQEAIAQLRAKIGLSRKE